MTYLMSVVSIPGLTIYENLFWYMRTCMTLSTVS